MRMSREAMIWSLPVELSLTSTTVCSAPPLTDDSFAPLTDLLGRRASEALWSGLWATLVVTAGYLGRKTGRGFYSYA